MAGLHILVTGGTGFIGSHTAVELLNAGHTVVLVDNLSNSKAEVLPRLQRISARAPLFECLDLRDRAGLSALFARHRFDAVVHFAGLKSVADSVAQPLHYYDNNVGGSMVLLEVMAAAGVKTLVFSSSATVYGERVRSPILEDFPLLPANPYGRSKWMIEEMLRDQVGAASGWRVAILRYFNPVGAHESGLIGEDPRGVPQNLLPYIGQVAAGQRARLPVYGADYETPDGTGMRDYIHVVDLARGHLKALEQLSAAPGLRTYNLGAGRAHSVLEMVRAFEQASGRAVPYEILPRRAGDIAAYYADASLAQRELGWRATRSVAQMCADVWRWQMQAAA
ncbi:MULTISPECIES: UDP-glucose 4-epimerase GalE [unclassified Duganella]|uniref:UDP-glucose 4-epimerase GalE n=1 Tax=unclassified Duganella TaxID=2636909 RepID=UPI000881930A|nr:MULTISPECIES: UDP-glucose 4-epimerase GalE [unclassified Duganella]SDH36251.1 UDP-glucose 4-epimerase [Duganella sp. OV458]SDK52613.1 UDP-galactose 4-epimerase [Duganella sp. OV510]